MKRLIAGILILAAVVAYGSNFEYSSVTAQPTDFQLTVRNITARQPLSPPLVIVHESNAVLLPSTAGRLDGLEEFAESGEHEALMESLSRRSGVKNVSRFGGTISPQQQFTLLRVSAEPGDHISVMGTLECTNDGIAMGTVIVPEDGGKGVWFRSGLGTPAPKRMTNRAPTSDVSEAKVCQTVALPIRTSEYTGIRVLR